MRKHLNDAQWEPVKVQMSLWTDFAWSPQLPSFLFFSFHFFTQTPSPTYSFLSLTLLQFLEAVQYSRASNRMLHDIKKKVRDGHGVTPARTFYSPSRDLHYNLPWPQGCWEHKLSLLSSRDPLNMLSLKDPSQSMVVNKIVTRRSIFIFLFLLVTHNQSSTSSIYICSHWFFLFGPQINRWSVASDWESYLFSLISSHHNMVVVPFFYLSSSFF